MMLLRQESFFYLVILSVAAISSFTVICAEEKSSKSDQNGNQDLSSSDETSSSQEDDSKEKRSREEIMFGNQQNRPNGLVDDLMGMAENMEDDDTLNVPNKKSNQTQEEGKEEKRNIPLESDDIQRDNDMMMGSGVENWYQNPPLSSEALQYLVNSPPIQSLPSEDFSNTLYDQDDLYRRKRQLIGQPIPLRKRSLRNSLGQMIQKRGIRMPRRSMRLKRQVDVEDLLTLLNNLDSNDRGRIYDEQLQVPGRFSTIGYPENPAPEYRYPYNLIQRDDGEMESDNADTIDDLMLLPPNSRYAESPFKSREEENEAIQNWLAKHTTPTVFSVSRRSTPVFYPLDYRYAPLYTKRSRIFNRNRMEDRSDEISNQDYGKWGQVVQVPEAYASEEDVARLYALANLLTEGDESEGKMRRSI